MLIVIIVIFIICWTPYLTFNLLQAFGVVGVQLHGFTKHAKTTFTLMAYLNRYSTVNILFVCCLRLSAKLRASGIAMTIPTHNL
jgi:hypothetical protein